MSKTNPSVIRLKNNGFPAKHLRSTFKNLLQLISPLLKRNIVKPLAKDVTSSRPNLCHIPARTNWLTRDGVESASKVLVSVTLDFIDPKSRVIEVFGLGAMLGH
ncbi:hypothetical protein OIU85_012095 [Salix viminalis]|uniref:Uncharacterized protein n=1 Tax=Salix viminalis TaxID=40686 RepID=A0A9Q0SGB5_SALVM|nr:hypothetical protein OIU85_012095 [Salix viminalis]